MEHAEVYVPDSGLISCEYPGGQVFGSHGHRHGQVLHRWPHMQLQVSRAINLVMSLVADSSDFLYFAGALLSCAFNELEVWVGYLTITKFFSIAKEKAYFLGHHIKMNGVKI